MEFSSILPARSLEDILAERVRLRVDGEVIDLPALPYADVEEWKASLEADLTSTLGGISEMGDDVGSILATLQGQMPRLVDALYSYDRMEQLPPREVLLRKVTSLWIVRAVLEAWRAATPLVDIGLAAMEPTLTSVSSPRSSSPSANGKSHRAKRGRR